MKAANGIWLIAKALAVLTWSFYFLSNFLETHEFGTTSFSLKKEVNAKPWHYKRFFSIYLAKGRFFSLESPSSSRLLCLTEHGGMFLQEQETVAFITERGNCKVGCSIV